MLAGWVSMESDRQRWDARYGVLGWGGSAEPEPWLVAHAALIPQGPLLDVAAGIGRHTLWLAARGHAVTALDISSEGLARLRTAASARGLVVATVVADLDEPLAPAGLGPFAALIVARYAPSATQWHRLLGVLGPRGRVFVCSFGRDQHLRTGFPLAFCLDEAELRRVLQPDLRCLLYERFEQDGEALEGSIWERRA